MTSRKKAAKETTYSELYLITSNQNLFASLVILMQKSSVLCFRSCSDCEPFVGPAVALLNSHMGDFDTTEVPFSTFTSSLFVCFSRAHTSAFFFHAYHHLCVREVFISLLKVITLLRLLRLVIVVKIFITIIRYSGLFESGANE